MPPTWFWIAVAALNGATFCVYGYDKWRATRAGQRVPEKTLVMFALAGGWPGAYLAMRTFRHKTSKPPFRRRVLAATVLNVALIVGAVWGARHFGWV